MSDSMREGAHIYYERNRDIAKDLRSWEGDYHYPAGLLRAGAEEIERLRERLIEVGWKLSPDRMGS